MLGDMIYKLDATISISVLITWLTGQKYTTVDETSDTMTEKFEKEHQWELSRNCFINKMIRELETFEGRSRIEEYFKEKI